MSSVKTIRTSVRSVAGRPSSGAVWRKPLTGVAAAQTGSFNTSPSSAGGCSTATALIVFAMPCAATSKPAARAGVAGSAAPGVLPPFCEAGAWAAGSAPPPAGSCELSDLDWPSAVAAPTVRAIATATVCRAEYRSMRHHYRHMSLHLSVLLVYAAAMMALGLWVGCRVHDASDFFVAGC